MKIADIKVHRPEDEESFATVTIEFMEYELQELMNQERERIECGLPIGEARIAIERFTLYRLAMNKAATAKRA